jgi:hypothetical protein
VLAYVFWHRPLQSTQEDTYEREHLAFHRSLTRSPPVGLRGSASFRVAEIPWLAAHEAAQGRDGAGRGYEDWYLLADFTALGVLNEAAVGRGHRSSHDRVARHFGAGAGGLYCLIEGDAHTVASPQGETSLATWVTRPPGSTRRALGELLGDGMDPLHASLWRRQLVLGPAPEFCLLSREPSAGVAPARLPAGWSAQTLDREVLFSG